MSSVILMAALIAGGGQATTAAIRASAPDIPVMVAAEAAEAMECARIQGRGGQATRLAVIDYTRPSSEKRMWVIDLVRRRLLFKEHVSHGQGSGAVMANRFSNQEGSHATSLGLFLTDSTYQGGNGYSLRLSGLSGNLNSRARERAIVIHGASYVRPSDGAVGRSWGCPAVRPSVAKPLIDTLQNGQFVYAFGPGSSKAAACREPALLSGFN